MIGIFLVLGELFARGALSLRETYKNEIYKKTDVTKDGLCYIDSKGRRRLLSNDHVADLSTDPYTGDYILTDIKTRRVIKNFSAEKRAENRKKNIEIMKKYGNTVYYEDKYKTYTDTHEPYGVRFYDGETGECYVIRNIAETCWFMRVKDGKIIRKTDRQIAIEKGKGIDPNLTTAEDATKRIEWKNDKKLNYTEWGKGNYDVYEISYLERKGRYARENNSI